MARPGSKADTHDVTDEYCEIDRAVLDLQHLGKYTAGDKELIRELLVLFNEQLARQLETLHITTRPDDWQIATHTLKGAARAVGAWEIADTAEALEQLDCQTDTSRRAELTAILQDQAEACRAMIEQLSQAS